MTDLISQEVVVARAVGVDTVVGTVYRIVSQSTLDFTSVGALNNTAGTIFIATAVDTLGSGDALSEITTPHKGTFSWPYVAGANIITAQNDRDFSSGNIGNWEFSKNCTDATLAYDATNIGGTDNKQALITVDETADPCAWANAFIRDGSAPVVLNKLYRFASRIYLPVGNTNKVVKLSDFGYQKATASTMVTKTLVGDTWTLVPGYVFVTDGITGSLQISFNGDPVDGDLLYYDDVSADLVKLSWIPYDLNLVGIDETNDSLKITYVNNANGAYLLLSAVSDLSSNLTPGQRYILEFYGIVGAGDTITVEVLSQDGVTTLVDSGNIAETRTLYRLFFTASHATGDRIRFTGMAAGDIINIDTLSLRTYGGGKGIGMGLGMDTPLRQLRG